MKKYIIDKKAYVASLDIHCQNTFTPVCPDELPIAGGVEIVPELNAQAKFAAFRIGSKEAHNAKARWVATEKNPILSPISGDNMDVYWPAHSVVGTKGFELIDGLPALTEYDFFIWEGIELDMHPYGVCYHDHAENLSTGLIEFLQKHHITTVIIGGLAIEYCVKVSALQLVKAGFKVVLNLAASRGLEPATTAQALKDLKSAGVICVRQAAQLENRLN